MIICPEIYNVFANNSTTSSGSIAFTCCILEIYVLLVICTFGFLANVVCGAVFCMAYGCKATRRTRQWSPLLPSLIALIIFDGMQLILSIMLLVIPSILSYASILEYDWKSPIIRVLNNVAMTSVFLFYPVLMTANYASIWTITVICIQRYFAICHPIKSRRYRWLKKTKLAIFIVTFVAASLNVVRYWEFKLVWYKMAGVNDSWYVTLDPTQLMNSGSYLLILDGAVYSLVMYIIPVSCLTVLNACIIYSILTSGKVARNTMHRHGAPQLEHSEQQSALMILAVTVIFCTCHTLAPIHRWWGLLGNGHHDGPGSGWFLVQDLSNLLINISSALNPIIYFIFTKKFRALFMELVRPGSSNNSRKISQSASSRKISETTFSNERKSSLSFKNFNAVTCSVEAHSRREECRNYGTCFGHASSIGSEITPLSAGSETTPAGPSVSSTCDEPLIQLHDTDATNFPNIFDTDESVFV